jgi:SPP1 family predicted phage head-tail adaptor
VSPLSVREFFSAAQVQSEATTKIRMRYRRDVDQTCRIGYTADYTSPITQDIYDVLGVIADEKTNRREITLLCKLNKADKR